MDFAAELVVIGQVIGDCREAADTVQVGPAEGQCGSQSEFGDADEGSDQRAWREIRRDAQGFPAAWEGCGFRPVDACDQADGGVMQWRCDVLYVIWRDRDIRVIHDKNRVAGRVSKIHQDASLVIRRTLRAVDCADLCSGEFGDGPMDVREGGFVRILIAEEELEIRVILVCVRVNGFEEAVLQAVDWF